mmetsp:Transcript_20056/g.62053  ORF Transcript_20056/g.62053 Transcript_20056/m.62053 type:complete len:206 (+) Transcript_20056:88-705(+)
MSSSRRRRRGVTAAAYVGTKTTRRRNHRGLLGSRRSEELGDVGEDEVGARGGVDGVALADGLEVVDDGHGGVEVGLEAFLDGLGVVVGADGLAGAGGGGGALEDAFLHDGLGGVEIEQKLDVGAVGHVVVPALEVVEVPREAVDEEVALPGADHGLFEELERDLDGDDLALADEAVDQLPVLRRWVFALRPQQVARRQVRVAELL